MQPHRVLNVGTRKKYVISFTVMWLPGFSPSLSFDRRFGEPQSRFEVCTEEKHPSDLTEINICPPFYFLNYHDSHQIQ